MSFETSDSESPLSLSARKAFEIKELLKRIVEDMNLHSFSLEEVREIASPTTPREHTHSHVETRFTQAHLDILEQLGLIEKNPDGVSYSATPKAGQQLEALSHESPPGRVAGSFRDDAVYQLIDSLVETDGEDEDEV